MKTEFKSYLNEIGISGAILERVEEIFKFYNEYLKFEIDEIFVCDYIDADGSRIYESLWFLVINIVLKQKTLLFQIILILIFMEKKSIHLIFLKKILTS